MKFTKKTIDWPRVEMAMRRGKLGCMRPGDQELCDAAIQLAREEYSRRKRRIDAETIADEKAKWRP